MRSADADLEQAFSAHEPWALETLYARYGKTFYAAAFGVLRSVEDAQDCVQDVLLRLWRRPETYAREKGALKAFVAVCVRNEALTRLRAKRRAPELERRASSQTEEETTFEPFDHVEHNRLVRAMQELPPPQRQAIVLAYFKHLTHREIAERTGDPIGTIKSRLSTAVHRLRDLMTETATP